MTTLLLITDIAAQAITPEWILKFTKEHQFEIKGLLISGVVDPSGTYNIGELKEAFQQAADVINLTLHHLGLASDRLAILPNLIDVSWGYEVFSSFFHLPMTGQPFEPNQGRIVDYPLLRLIAFNTIQAIDFFGLDDAVFHAALNADMQQPGAITVALMQHSLNQWHLDPAESIHRAYVEGHYQLAICGQNTNPFQYRNMLTLGTSPPFGLLIKYSPPKMITTMKLVLTKDGGFLGAQSFSLEYFEGNS